MSATDEPKAAERITVEYDPAKLRAVLTFPNGSKLALQNTTQERAERFARVHGPEFEKSDCCFQFVDGKVELPSGLKLNVPVTH